MQEKIIETKICKHCNSNFDITDKDLEFYEKISPVFTSPLATLLTGKGKNLGGDKIKYLIPPPTLCPDCRQQRRLSWKNERNLYKRKCDVTGKDIISIYSPNKLLKVYDQEIWRSDKWDAMDYARDFDFSRSFFEQFSELKMLVPHLSMINTTPENSEYCNATTGMKNSYLCFNAIYGENCYYCKGLSKSKYAIDCLRVFDCEICYQCIDCHQCYNGLYLQNCKNCKDSSYCFDCIGCSDCIGCIGLNNKKYYIFNKLYSKIDYFTKIKQIKEKLSIEEIYDLFLQEKLKVPHKFAILDNCEDCIGDNIYDSKNAHYCYDIVDTEQIKYCYDLRENNFMSYDIANFGNNIGFSYEANSSGSNMQHCSFVDYCWNEVSNILYSSFCLNNSSNLFGCVGLKNKSYCILNKQYTKEQYEELVPKIIEHMTKTGEWGEFFPSSMSPFGYNETVAMEYFPVSRDFVIPVKTGIYKNVNNSNLNYEANANNNLIDSGLNPEGRDKISETFHYGPIFNRSTYEPPFPKVEKIIPTSKLPNNISDIPDDVINWAIECEVTKKPFRIIKQELEFYRKHNLPIPKRHPDQRHLDRMALRNPRKLFDRKCDKCGKNIKTTYSPERSEIIYCEECYNKEIY